MYVCMCVCMYICIYVCIWVKLLRMDILQKMVIIFSTLLLHCIGCAHYVTSIVSTVREYIIHYNNICNCVTMHYGI